MAATPRASMPKRDAAPVATGTEEVVVPVQRLVVAGTAPVPVGAAAPVLQVVLFLVPQLVCVPHPLEPQEDVWRASLTSTVVVKVARAP